MNGLFVHATVWNSDYPGTVEPGEERLEAADRPPTRRESSEPWHDIRSWGSLERRRQCKPFHGRDCYHLLGVNECLLYEKTTMSTVQRAFRLEETLDKQFCSIAERLGTSPSDALRMFVAAFVANKGFPFALRLSDGKLPTRFFDSNHPNVITPPVRDGHAVLPASWREDDDYDKGDGKESRAY